MLGEILLTFIQNRYKTNSLLQYNEITFKILLSIIIIGKNHCFNHL